MTNLNNLIEASENEYWACHLGLLKFLRSLEGGTRVQQNNNWLLLQAEHTKTKADS
jgi:hypothetical protein